MSLLCGIDVGTQGTKVGLFRPDGSCLATSYAEHQFQHLRSGWIEMGPTQILDAVITALADAVAQVCSAAGESAEMAAQARAKFRDEHTHDDDEVRFFKVPEGWVGNFTGDDIATRFPSHDAIVSA